MNKTSKFIVAIDPGTNTGMAMYNAGTGKLQLVTITEMHRALEVLSNYQRSFGPRLLVKIENPNLWTHFSKTKDAYKRLQGAGSVKRDFSIWKKFCIEREIEFEEFKPDKQRNAIAKNAEHFFKLTGYHKRSSHHARCAAMLIYFGKHRQQFKKVSPNFVIRAEPKPQKQES